jgi:hypothetical protein
MTDSTSRKLSVLPGSVVSGIPVGTATGFIPLTIGSGLTLTGTTLSSSGSSAGPIAAVGSISALRAVSKLSYSTAIVGGYYTNGDGGGGIYEYVSTDTSSTDNGGTLIVGADGGRWVYAEFQGEISVRVFGAKFDGATDDTTAIQNTINWIQTKGGGVVTFPTGKAIISSSIVVGTSATSLQGAGRGGLHDTGSSYTAATTLHWNGAAGGTMVKFYPSSTMGLRACNYDGIYLSGNGATMAGVGVHFNSITCSVHKVVGDSFTNSLCLYSCLPTTILQEYPDCQHNDIWINGYQFFPTTGALFKCEGMENGSTGNFSMNRIHQISGNHYNDAVIFGDSDTNQTYLIQLSRFSGGAGWGLVLNGINNALNYSCRSNIFYHVVAFGGVISKGTTSFTQPATTNTILWYDTGNGEPATPTIETGSSLYWSDSATAMGYQNRFVANANYNQLKYSDGRIRYSGKMTIAANGSGILTFPQYYSTSVVGCGATGTNTNATAIVIQPTLTGVAVYNANSVATDVWWWSEGI